MFLLDLAFNFTSFVIILNQYINSKNLFKVLKKKGKIALYQIRRKNWFGEKVNKIIH